MIKETKVSTAATLASSDSPQVYDRPTTTRLLLTVALCLSPSALWGVLAFGWYAGLVLATALATALATELLVLKLVGRAWRFDGHALVVGLLIGMVMPPAVPLYIPASAAFFAIALVKWPLGGLGASWLHPAAAGWAFALLSWPREMGRYILPPFFAGSSDAVAAPGALIRSWLAANPGGGFAPGDILNGQGYFHSALDGRVVDFLNGVVFAPFGASLPPGYVDAFLGMGPGTIGQTSSILFLVGSVALIARRVVLWQLPAAFFLAFSALMYVFGGLPFGTGWFSGDVLHFVLRGSFLLVLFFVATDFSTTPFMVRGHLVTGLLLGAFCFLISLSGVAADAALAAVLLVNLLTDLIDRQTRNRRLRLRRD
jgi:electron transport complex protein RnfD